jgi:hypothetical protein
VPSLPLLPPEITNPGNSNAVQPGDYTETDNTLTFAPGQMSHTFTVPIVDDSVPEDPELFHVSMSNVSGAGANLLPGPLSQSYVVILDDDGDTTDPDVTINQAAGQADPTSTSPIEFTAVFSEPVTGFGDGDIDLSGSTAGGTLAATVTGGPNTITYQATATDKAGNPRTVNGRFTTAAGHHRWVLDVTITHSLHHYKNWNLGVKIGNTMHVLHGRVS